MDARGNRGILGEVGVGRTDEKGREYYESWEQKNNTPMENDNRNGQYPVCTLKLWRYFKTVKVNHADQKKRHRVWSTFQWYEKHFVLVESRLPPVIQI